MDEIRVAILPVLKGDDPAVGIALVETFGADVGAPFERLDL